KAEVARLLRLSRGSLYYERRMPARDAVLREQIVAVMIENPGYGQRPVVDHLGVGKKRVARVMRKFSLKPARRAKSPRKPGDLGREVQPYPDLAAQICPIVPDHGRASDFT